MENDASPARTTGLSPDSGGLSQDDTGHGIVTIARGSAPDDLDAHNIPGARVSRTDASRITPSTRI